MEIIFRDLDRSFPQTMRFLWGKSILCPVILHSFFAYRMMVIDEMMMMMVFGWSVIGLLVVGAELEEMRQRRE